MEILNLIDDAAAQTSWQEWLAVICMVIYTIGAANEKIWCWPAAMVGSALYIYICASYALFLETILQVFYLLMAVAGLFFWIKKTADQTEKPILKWPAKIHLYWIIGLGLAVPLAGLLFEKFGSANAYLDAFTTLFSFFATFLVVKKVLENWLYWIVIDIASIFLYAERGLYLTVLLYVLYTILAVYGWLKWKKAIKPDAFA